MKKSTLDFTDAQNVLMILNERGNTQGYRIGVMSENAQGLCTHEKGKVVLYRVYDDNPKKCTVSTPMDHKWLEREKERGSLLVDYGTMVGVPINYVTDAPDAMPRTLKTKSKEKSKSNKQRMEIIEDEISQHTGF